MSEPAFEAFFGEQERIDRIFFVHGNTDDAYMVGDVMLNHFERMLEQHLVQLGYEMVLFYNGVQQLYCVSEAMASKREALFGQAAAAPEPEKPTLGQLEAFFGQTQTPENVADKPSLRFPLNDLEVSAYADQVMRNTSVRSAFVFSDGWDLIERTSADAQRSLILRMRNWYSLSAENANIAILLFGSFNFERIFSIVNTHPGWGFLSEKLFSGNKFSRTVKYVSSPLRDEITRRLRKLPVYLGLAERERELLYSGAQSYIASERGLLKALDGYLNTAPDAPQTLMQGNADADDAWQRLGQPGWEEICQAIRNLVATVRSRTAERPTREAPEGYLLRMLYPMRNESAGVPLHMVLKGNPGTGKTTIAKLLGSIYRKEKLLPTANVVFASREDLVGEYVGHTAVKTRRKINEALGGILFIDEAYALYRDNRLSQSDFGLEAIDTLTNAMTQYRGEFAVVLAGYPEPMERMLNANPGLRSRFGHNIVQIQDYPPPLLRDISIRYLETIRDAAGEARYRFSPELLTPQENRRAPLDVFFQNWFDARDRETFGNARACENLVDELVAAHIARHGPLAAGGEQSLIARADFPVAKYDALFVDKQLNIERIRQRLRDEIVGLLPVKKIVEEIIRLMRLRQRQNELAGQAPEASRVSPGHYLFSGNPGTGKTTVAQLLAEAMCAMGVLGKPTPVRLTGMLLLQEYERNGVEGVHKLIRQAIGGMLIIDEAHQLIRYPILLQALLDPMIEQARELSVVFNCYSDQLANFLASDSGLESRITRVVAFTDYSAEELRDIFLIRAARAGYRLQEGVAEAVLSWMANRLATRSEIGGYSQNGRYAEKLLRLFEIALSQREGVEQMSKEDLFTLRLQDFQRMEGL